MDLAPKLDEGEDVVGISEFLPDDWRDATLLGRIDFGQGPTPGLIRGGRIEDVSKIAPTTSDLMNAFAPGVMQRDSVAGVNLAVLCGFGLIVAAFVLALVYGFLCRHQAASDGERAR